jgi:hypothetical protein
MITISRTDTLRYRHGQTLSAAEQLQAAANMGLAFSIVAAVALSGGSFIHINSAGQAIKADASLNLEAHGYTPNAVSSGEAFIAARQGAFGGHSGIIPGADYWLGSNGQPSTAPPASGLCQLLGAGVAATVLSVDIEPAINP